MNHQGLFPRRQDYTVLLFNKLKGLPIPKGQPCVKCWFEKILGVNVEMRFSRNPAVVLQLSLQWNSILRHSPKDSSCHSEQLK